MTATATYSALPAPSPSPEGRRPRLFLCDGYALLYRSFYAMLSKPLRTKAGVNTSMAWGVANLLQRITQQDRPDAVAWVHDAGDSGRTALLPGYKATREKLEGDLLEEFRDGVQHCEALLRAFGVPLVAVRGYEADDVIGTLATQAAEAGWDVTVISGDKDFHQLVSERISLRNPGRGGPAAVDETVVTLANASERLGVPPEQTVDYLALLGDTSDNVPGVHGIGKTGARELLAQFGTLEALLERAAEVKGKRPREALLAQADAARLSQRLVTIMRDVPGVPAIEALAPRSVDREGLAALLESLEFLTLVTRFKLREDPAAAPQEPELPAQMGLFD